MFGCHPRSNPRRCPVDRLKTAPIGALPIGEIGVGVGKAGERSVPCEGGWTWVRPPFLFGNE